MGRSPSKSKTKSTTPFKSPGSRYTKSRSFTKKVESKKIDNNVDLSKLFEEMSIDETKKKLFSEQTLGKKRQKDEEDEDEEGNFSIKKINFGTDGKKRRSYRKKRSKRKSKKNKRKRRSSKK